MGMNAGSCRVVSPTQKDINISIGKDSVLGWLIVLYMKFSLDRSQMDFWSCIGVITHRVAIQIIWLLERLGTICATCTTKAERLVVKPEKLIVHKAMNIRNQMFIAGQVMWAGIAGLVRASTNGLMLRKRSNQGFELIVGMATN